MFVDYYYYSEYRNFNKIAYGGYKSGWLRILLSVFKPPVLGISFLCKHSEVFHLSPFLFFHGNEAYHAAEEGVLVHKNIRDQL